MRAYASGLFVHCAVIGLIAAQSLSPAGAQPADTSVRSALTRYSERMATLATGLDRASALAGRASRIADPAQVPAAAPSGSRTGGVSSGTNAAGLSADEVMAGLRQRIAQRTQVLQLAAAVAGKLNAQTPGETKPLPAAARSSAGRRVEENYESLIGLAADLAKADFKADVAAARSALDALRTAAQNAAALSLKNTPPATAAGLVPERIAKELAQGTAPDFSRVPIEDAMIVVFALVPDDDRADLHAVLAKATQENDRVYRAAVKANLAVDGAIMDLGLAAADRQLTLRRISAVEGNDLAGMVRTMIGNAGNLMKTDVKDQLKKLAEQLSELKGRKRQVISQIIELEGQIAQIEADCGVVADRVAAAIEAAKQAAAGAAVGAVIGGFFGGPVGAMVGGAIGGAAGAIGAAGASPADVAHLEDCQKKLIALMRELARLQGELAKIDVAIKQLLNQIEALAKKRNEQEERVRTEREAAGIVSKPKGSAAKLKESDAVRRTPLQDGATAKTRQDAAKNAPVVERPCGTPDKPCRPAAASRAASPGGGGSAMDRLSGGGGGGVSSTAGGGSRPGAAAGVRSPNAAAPSSAGSSGGAAVPASSINRNAIGVGVSSPPERLR